MSILQVADAVGAAVGKISGEHQEMVTVSSPDNIDQLVEQCITKAKDNAIANGANPCSLTVVEKCIDPAGTGIYVKVAGSPKDLIEEVTDMHSDPIGENKLILKHKIKAEDNPYWPFENEEVANLDKEFELPEPIISM